MDALAGPLKVYFSGYYFQHVTHHCHFLCFLPCFRVGRAMLRPIFAQKSSRSGRISPKLREALAWWHDVLSRELSETREWSSEHDTPVFLFVDAASTPARCAAVFAGGGDFSYTAMDPPAKLLAQLKSRNDNQITSLEIIAIQLALNTFQPALTGRSVVLYSDNTGMFQIIMQFSFTVLCSVLTSGAERSTTKGASRAFDHNALVHGIWSFTLKHRIDLWVERVPSEFNISDCPSRWDTRLMQQLGAHWVDPVLDDVFF